MPIEVPTKKDLRDLVKRAVEKESKWWETEYQKLWQRHIKLEERIKILEG